MLAYQGWRIETICISVPVLTVSGLSFASLAFSLAGANGGGVMFWRVLSDIGGQFMAHVHHALVAAGHAMLTDASFLDNLQEEINFWLGMILKNNILDGNDILISRPQI